MQVHEGIAGTTYRLDLCYDGTPFCGWAVQDGKDSVQGFVLGAIERVTGERPVLRVAGRTDAGVHARRQVTSFVLNTPMPPQRLARAIDALTPCEIGVVGCWVVPSGFDARSCACSRSYRYYVLLRPYNDPFWFRYSWRVSFPLDMNLLHAAACRTVGRHDFRAFTPTQTEHVFFNRTVLSCSWTQYDNLLWLDIEADAFLRHMVRILVGTMIDVGRGKLDLSHFERLLAGANREEAGPTAPARGLFLWNVSYAEQWAVDDGPFGLTPSMGSTIMPTCVSRRYGEDLFGKTW